MDEDNDELWTKIMAELIALNAMTKPYQKSEIQKQKQRQRRKSFFILNKGRGSCAGGAYDREAVK